MNESNVTLVLLVRVPSRRSLRRLFPAGNYVAAKAVFQALSARLRLEGIETTFSSYFGELNRSCYLFEVSERNRALAVLRKEISELFFGGHVNLGYFDAAEGIYRPLDSVSCGDFNAQVVAMFGGMSGATRAHQEALLRLLQCEQARLTVAGWISSVAALWGRLRVRARSSQEAVDP